MKADQLLEVYEQISEAPDAIARLRRFVLDLAVRGKLVEQDAADEPASELLKRIANEKARLAKAGQIKPAKQISMPDQANMSVPSGWQVVPLGEVINSHLGGGTPSKNNQAYWGGSIRWASVKDVGKTKYLDETIDRISEEGLANSSSNMIPAGNLIVVTRMGLGQLSINRVAVAINQDLRALFLSPFLDIDFVYNFFLTYGMEGTGLTVKGIKLNELLGIPFPLPPLAEQHRIVAKVDELMVLCDRLEEARKTREELRDKLTAASLARLTAPGTSDQAEAGQGGTGLPSDDATTQEDDFQTHASFALEVLPALTTRPDQIKTLRQTILNLAVRGKLVEQDPAEEPATELVKRIALERADLIQRGEVSKQKPSLSVEGPETPFSLPDSWTWCRFGSLVLASDAGWSPRTENHARVGDAWGVLKVSAVSWDKFDPEANKQVLPGTEPRLQAQVRRGDFLISRANTAELVARAVLVQEEPKNLMMSDKIVRLRLASDCDHRFAWLVNNYSDYGRDYYAANATGVSPSMKNVSRVMILNLPIPLPPLAEQHRIMAKVDALMALCDRLEAALTTTDTTRTRFLEALLHEALQPAEAELEAAE